MTFINDLLNDQPRPGIDFSYPKTVGEIETPGSNSNKKQQLGSSGREITASGEVWKDSDVQSLLNEIQNSSVQTISIPELQESIKVMPTGLSLTEEKGEVDRHHYEITLKETS